MKIIIDTREQLPLNFDNYEYVDSVVVDGLTVGDYACEFHDGYRPPVQFERKSIGDLFSTLTAKVAYRQFKAKIARAKKKDIMIILIVECTLLKVAAGYEYSTRNGISIIRQMLTIWLKYGVVPVFCNGREEMAKYIYEYFCAIGRLKVK